MLCLSQPIPKYYSTCSPGNGHLKVRPHLCIHPRHLAPSNTLVNYGALLGPSIPNPYTAPLVFQMACKQNLDLRCALISDPSTLGAGAKTRLESRIKMLIAYTMYVQARS